MKFTVTWSAEVEDDLAQLWLEADEPKVVTEEFDRLEKLLGNEATEVGESRIDQGIRVYFGPTFGVMFEVNDGDRTVNVLRIWQIRRKG